MENINQVIGKNLLNLRKAKKLMQLFLSILTKIDKNFSNSTKIRVD